MIQIERLIVYIYTYIYICKQDLPFWCNYAERKAITEGHMYIHIYIYIYMYIYVYMYIYMCIYVCTCRPSISLFSVKRPPRRAETLDPGPVLSK
jgi:hypothetical protein